MTTEVEAHHAPLILDRGQGWSHRYEPSCGCRKWQGIAMRTRRKAMGAYRAHVTAEARRLARLQRRGRGHRRRAQPAPGPLTRAEDLPEQLR